MAACWNDDHYEDLLQKELARVLKSVEFVRSPVMSQLLQYLVDQSIFDPDNPPKAYQVAVDGLGRTEDFDVQADSYPRVQVGRLRKMLAAYYAQKDASARITIPTGHYAVVLQVDPITPVFEEKIAENETSQENPGKSGVVMQTWRQKLLQQSNQTVLIAFAVLLIFGLCLFLFAFLLILLFFKL